MPLPLGNHMPEVSEAVRLARELRRHLEKHNLLDCVFLGIGVVPTDLERKQWIAGRAAIHLPTDDEMKEFLLRMGHFATCDMVPGSPGHAQINTCTCGFRERHPV